MAAVTHHGNECHFQSRASCHPENDPPHGVRFSKFMLLSHREFHRRGGRIREIKTLSKSEVVASRSAVEYLSYPSSMFSRDSEPRT